MQGDKMPNVYHDFPVNGSLEAVYRCISTPEGLSTWWSKSAKGDPGIGNTYEFDFGPGYQWEAEIREYLPNQVFVLRMTLSDTDWDRTTVSFTLEPKGESVMLHFAHEGWPENNSHYRSSSYCWAMYLRCLKRYVEKGIKLDYEKRLDGE